MKRVISLLLALSLVFGLLGALSLQAAADTVGVSCYTKDWRLWAQGASAHSNFVANGCYLTAEAKLLAEAGVTNGNMNPDQWAKWMIDNGHVRQWEHLEETDKIGSGMMEYIRSKGISVNRIDGDYVSLSGLTAAARVQKIWNYIKSGYYVILQASGGHQTYLSRKDSLAKGKPMITNSGHDLKKARIYSYKGYKRTWETAQAEEGVAYPEANFTKAYIYKVGTVPPQAAAPTMKTENYEGGVRITLQSAESGAKIYYSLDGAAFAQYTNALELTKNTTVRAYALISGKIDSAEQSWTVKVEATPAPTIDVKPSASGFRVTISAADGAKVYYTLDGSSPLNSSTRYYGAETLTVGSGTKIRAVAVKSGMRFSAEATYDCAASLPGAPTLSLAIGASDTVGVGDSIRVRWTAVSDAFGYEYTVKKDAAAYLTGETEGTVLTLPAAEPGVYTITVRALNFLGAGEESLSPLTVTVMADVTVTFTDWDGTVLSSQTVKYGGSAVPPAAPERVGHSFTRWNGSYIGVKADQTVVAAYTPNTYTVTFVDEAGTVLASELAEYGKPVQTVPEAPERLGYTFVGWSVKSGEGDSYTAVNGDAVFSPTYAWTNPDLPLALSAVSALRSTDATSYAVTVRAANQGVMPVQARLIAVVKTANGKVVATKIDAITVPANASDYTQTIVVGSTAVGSVAEVYAVGRDSRNDDRTGGALSAAASCPVTCESSSVASYWGEWSDWSETPVTASNEREVEQKTEYRYADQETTTSTASSLSGWTQTGSYVSYGNWGAWSSWSVTAQTASSTKEVATRIVYKYQHYCDGKGNIAPSTAYTYGKYGPHTLYFTTKQPVSRTSSTGYTITDGLAKCSYGASSYYYMGTATQYRYRTRTATTYYTYARWGAWSDWSDTVYVQSSTRKVETRTVYRYRDLKTVTVTESNPYLGEENTAGTEYRIRGSLTMIDGNYAGKTATVLVYKDRNTDPTEGQLEYVGQVVLGAGNAYDFSFIPREEISVETGNYVVSFGLPTADGLINNAEIIEAPKPVYTVVFKDLAGNILSSQSVVQGADAEPPALPEQEGYTVSWNRSFTDVSRSLIVSAVAVPKTYPVIFVDWANAEIVRIDEAVYGSEIDFPAPRTAVGKTFTGWSLPEGSVVNGTTVVEAVYEDIRFTVSFLNKDGTVFEAGEVPYGGAAAIPEEQPTAEGYEFIAWDYTDRWWNVTEDVAVSPIFIYSETAEAPARADSSSGDSDSEIFFEDAVIELVTATADATILYTMDGSDPLEHGLVYDGPLTLTASATLRTVTRSEGRNDSPEAAFEITVLNEADLPTVTILTGHSQFSVGADTAAIPAKFENLHGDELLSYGFALHRAGDYENHHYEVEAGNNANAESFGRLFNVTGLEAGTEYGLIVFGVYAQAGVVSSAELEFTTEGGTTADPCAEYDDVERESWYHAAADFVIANGYMGSTSQTVLHFEPYTKVSRAMVASILYRIAGAPADVEYTGTFTDVPEGQWFTTAIEWCAQNGLASGKGDGRFDPNGNVTRQELAVFMFKLDAFLHADDQDRDPVEPADLSAFPDANTVPAWALDYVRWAVAAGLITGKGQPDGTTLLAPADTAMRCELASILQRFLMK